MSLLIRILIVYVISCTHLCFAGASLNRPHFEHRQPLPAIPYQSKSYINIVNYNIRVSHCDESKVNCWENRKSRYFEVIQMEDEAKLMMQKMSNNLKVCLRRYLPHSAESCHELKIEDTCKTCHFRDKEPFPIHETRYFRIALKTGCNEGVLYGNFPYPYRLIIVLKRHDSIPNPEEWSELRVILKELQTNVCDYLGAEYSSYASLQDNFYRNQAKGKEVSSTTHFFVHYIFRFPKGVTISGVPFKDPNPYEQFNLSKKNLVKELETKAGSNFIYKKPPDIINTQELTFEQAEDLKRQFSNHHFIGYTAFDGKPLDCVKPGDWVDEIVSIGYRKDRFDFLDSGVRWLSPTPDKPSICLGASRKRIVVWAKLRDKHSNTVFYIFNSHYDHIGPTKAMVDAEIDSIKSIANNQLWFATGERFYTCHDGEWLYDYFLSKISCQDVRDSSLMGHFGESGTWGGFENDPYASTVVDGSFECDTLDVTFTNNRQGVVLLSYHVNGAFDPETQKVYAIQDPVKKGYRLASDHFMSGFYFLLDK